MNQKKSEERNNVIKQIEYPDSLFWTTLSMQQLEGYRIKHGNNIPRISFNIWGAEEKSAGHKHLDELLEGVQPENLKSKSFEWGDDYVLISVEEPHNYFFKDPFTEGSLENGKPIPLDKHILVELVGSNVPPEAISGLKLSERVKQYYRSKGLDLSNL